ELFMKRNELGTKAHPRHDLPFAVRAAPQQPPREEKYEPRILTHERDKRFKGDIRSNKRPVKIDTEHRLCRRSLQSFPHSPIPARLARGDESSLRPRLGRPIASTYCT